MTNTSKLIYAKSYKGKEKIFVGDTHSYKSHTRLHFFKHDMVIFY